MAVSGTSTKNSENIFRSIYDFILNAIQVVSVAYSPTLGADKVFSIGGNLVPDQYDDIKMTYVASGNGAGQISTVQYFKASTLIATLTLTYDSSSRIIDVART